LLWPRVVYMRGSATTLTEQSSRREGRGVALLEVSAVGLRGPDSGGRTVDERGVAARRLVRASRTVRLHQVPHAGRRGGCAAQPGAKEHDWPPGDGPGLVTSIGPRALGRRGKEMTSMPL